MGSTFEDLAAEVAIKVPPLTADDVVGLKAAFDQDQTDGGSRVAMMLQAIADGGRAPDKTGWQVAADVFATAEKVAGEAAPFIGFLTSLAAL